MITENDLDVETGEVLSVDPSGEHSARVKKMVPCGNDCSACPHGPYTFQVDRDGDELSWEYIGKT